LSFSMPPPIFYVCSTVLRSLPNSPANTKFLKTPFEWGPPAQRDPRVVATVSKSAQHHRNRRTGRRSRLRGQDRSSYGAGGGAIRDGIRAAGERLTPQLRDALQIGPTKKSGQQTRSHLLDFQTELGPGLVAGHKYIPVQRVGEVTRATTTPQLADAVDVISSYEGHVRTPHVRTPRDRKQGCTWTRSTGWGTTPMDIPFRCAGLHRYPPWLWPVRQAQRSARLRMGPVAALFPARRCKLPIGSAQPPPCPPFPI